MIATNYDGQDFVLLNDEPDWSGGVQLDVSLPTRRQRGLTGREARRAAGDSLRLALTWSANLETAAANALRDVLQAMENLPVLCPCWSFAVKASEFAALPVASALYVAWDEGWTDFEISDAPDPGDWDFIAPLLRGAFTNWPEARWPAPGVAQVRFAFEEDSTADFALIPDVVAFTNGPALGDATVPKIFPLPIEWSEAPTAGTAEVEISREAIGDSRQRAETYFPQSAERPQAGRVVIESSEDAALFLRWWLDRRGDVGAHYAPTLALAARLAVQANAGTNTITLTDADGIGANRYLFLTDGFTEEVVKVSGVAGNVCTLTANLANTWKPTNTSVWLAMLARHNKSAVALNFITPEVATLQTGWREVPAEYTPAGVETRGTTLGALVTKAWLYQVTLDWDGATEVHRMTGFERDLTADGEDWTSRPIEHSALRQTIAMDRDEITIKTRWWEGSPFEKFLPNELDCKVRLDIYECDVDGSAGDNVAQWFGGEITSMPEADGPVVSFKAAGANALFDRPLLKPLLQPGCNDELFGPWCQLARADWEFTAEVYSVAGKVVTFENFARSGGLPTGWGFVHYFALGYVERTINALPVRLFIFDSAVKDGGNRVAVTFGATAAPVFTVGEDVVIVPGCDNRPETCKAYHAVDNPTGKFNNYPKFAGFPFMPDKDPALQPLKKSNSNTGKK